MTAPPSPPNRRRRRIVVGIAVLLVVGPLGMWWYKPYVDRTFVGRWKVTLGNSPERYFGPLILDRDGTGQFVVHDSQITRSFAFEWRVTGGNFVILGQNRSGIPVWDRAMQQAYAYTGSPVFRGYDRFAVHQQDDGSVHLASWGQPSFFPANLTIAREVE